MKINGLGWMIYFVMFNLYCVFWRQYGLNQGYDFIDSLLWYVKEWGVWTLLTPVLLLALETKVRVLSLWITRIASVVMFMLLVFCLRMLFNTGEFPNDTATIVVHLFPQYSSGLIIVLGAWLFIQQHLSTIESAKNSAKSKSSTGLVIEHNGLNMQIQFDDIISIKTAGNYVEIDTDNQTYLTRTTLKALLTELPEVFQQVHRSFVININKLHKLTHLENGGGKAILSNQQSIPVSKRYKSQLKSLIVPDLPLSS